jgi:VanZ family protein
MIMAPLVLRIARIVFWIAALVTAAAAFAPPQEAVDLLPWDKAGHFLAFYGLTVLAVLAFPGRHLLGVAVALSAFGGLIEVVQSLPLIHRDAEWLDWVADSAAIAAVLIPMALVSWRGQSRRL